MVVRCMQLGCLIDKHLLLLQSGLWLSAKSSPPKPAVRIQNNLVEMINGNGWFVYFRVLFCFAVSSSQAGHRNCVFKLLQQRVSEYDQQIPQSHTLYQLTTP